MANQIEDIKSAVDIVTLIGERVHLTRSGKNFKGLCPFHSEKTSSFFVTPELQRYKCFGCGKSGDVLTFLQDYDSLTFAEALQTLADRTGILLEKRVFSPQDHHRQRLYEVLSLAQEYYHYLLTEHKLGEPARAYLKDRGITRETIKTFHLGYAFNAWEGLQNFLIKKKGYSTAELIDAGLIIRKTGSSGTYDRFRHRLIFPLTNAQGKVVGFSGRVLDSTTKEAKYINSPETELYHKSELLFGYSVLRNIIRKEEEVIVVEGEFDVLSSYQAGVKHIVAIKGSALTEKQLGLLARSVKRVILALDADAAGIEATRRAIATAQSFDLSLRVLPLHGGKDPDSIALESPKGWREMVRKTVSVYEFLIDGAFTSVEDAQSGEGKRLVTQRVVPVLSSIQNAVEQSHYIGLVATRLGVDREALERELQKHQHKFLISPAPAEKVKKVEKKINKQEMLERYTIALLLHSNAEQSIPWTAAIEDIPLQSPVVAKLFAQLKAFLGKYPMSIEAFARTVPDELKQPLSDMYLEVDEEAIDLEKEWKITLERLQEIVRVDHIQQLGKKIAMLEDKETKSQEEEKDLQHLQQELKKMIQ